MQHDGHVDYASYSVEELLEAWETIDAEAYPLNLEALTRELASRNLVVREQAEPTGNEARKPESRGTWSARELIAQVALGLCIGAIVLGAMMMK